jgi:hypothetical protein
MTASPLRYPWQVHLSTTIFMVITSGVAIGLNLRSNTEVQGFSFSGKSPLNSETKKNLNNVCWYGWPFPVLVTQKTVAESNIDIASVRVGVFQYGWGWNYLALLADAIVMLLVLAGLAWISESIIRRRAVRSTS